MVFPIETTVLASEDIPGWPDLDTEKLEDVWSVSQSLVQEESK